MEAVDKLKLSRALPEKLIDKLLLEFKGKSVKEFFSKFMADYDKMCHIYNEIQDKIMKELKMKNLFGKTYFIKIDDIQLN